MASGAKFSVAVVFHNFGPSGYKIDHLAVQQTNGGGGGGGSGYSAPFIHGPATIVQQMTYTYKTHCKFVEFINKKKKQQ